MTTPKQEKALRCLYRVARILNDGGDIKEAEQALIEAIVLFDDKPWQKITEEFSHES